MRLEPVWTRRAAVLCVAIAWCSAAGCSEETPPGDVAASSAQSLVLQYADFGPPSMATPLLGSEWWQWDAHGDSVPSSYQVKVVVHRGMSQGELVREYPVLETGLQDHRYVSYDQAMEYLALHIREDAVPVVTERLIETRDSIQAALKP